MYFLFLFLFLSPPFRSSSAILVRVWEEKNDGQSDVTGMVRSISLPLLYLVSTFWLHFLELFSRFLYVYSVTTPSHTRTHAQTHWHWHWYSHNSLPHTQIQALLDQHTTKLTMSQSTYRSIEESAPPQDRLK